MEGKCMSSWILISIFLGVIAIIIGIIVFLTLRKNQKEGRTKEVDYRAFFIMGICFLPLGIIFTATINIGFMGFIAIGLIYMSIGLANRDKWKNKEK
jgi:flagellar basal body-associated protein FliL